MQGIIQRNVKINGVDTVVRFKHFADRGFFKVTSRGQPEIKLIPKGKETVIRSPGYEDQVLRGGPKAVVNQAVKAMWKN